MTALAPVLQAFFTDRLITQRNASPHTIVAYRGTFRLLLGFTSARTGKTPSALDIADLDAPLIVAFLDYLEVDRHSTVRTRNWRLAAIHSLFGYAALGHPEHAASIQRVLAIPTKRHERRLLTWLTDPEVDALLAAPERTTWAGRRDHAMLVLAVQTGLRISELIALSRSDLTLGVGPTSAAWAKDVKSVPPRSPPSPSLCCAPGSRSTPAAPTTRCSRHAPERASATMQSNAASPATSPPPAPGVPRFATSTSRCTPSDITWTDGLCGRLTRSPW